eukprot:maker-scaffold236_size242448-snap-gene-1.19 protein:Tk09801 transcript:maker-scaffold236_size242448-snap-gene-1.19-mRNA-1 annotation:"PREDICTED: uncharacterized protein LOC101452950"
MFKSLRATKWDRSAASTFLAALPVHVLTDMILVHTRSSTILAWSTNIVATLASGLGQFYGRAWNYTIELFAAYREDLVAKFVICPDADPELQAYAQGRTVRWLKSKILCPSVLAQRKQPVRVAYRGLPPFINLGQGSGPTGIDIDQMEFLSEALGFQMVLEGKKSWLDVNPQTGEMSGLIPSVANGSCQIGSGHLVMISETHFLVDYVYYSYPLDIKIVAPKPKRLKPYWNVMRPFTPIIWMTFVGVFLGMLVVYPLSIALLSGFRGSQPNARASWTSTLLWLLAVPLSQSHLTNFPKGVSVAILTLFWVVYCMAMSQFYASNLRANLISIDFERPLETVQDLLDRNKILYLPSGYTTVELYKASGSPALRTMAFKVEAGNYLFDYDQFGFPIEAKIFQTGNAFIMTDLMAKAAFPTFATNHGGVMPYRISKTPVAPGMAGPIVPKGVPYLEDLTRAAQILDQSGINQLFIRKLCQYLPVRFVVALHDIAFGISFAPFDNRSAFGEEFKAEGFAIHILNESDLEG